MPASPFPGMDPYLERHWLDVHGRLVTYAADAINGLLPDDLVARSEERIAVASRDDETRRRYLGPDVRVFEIARFGTTHTPAADHDQGAVAVLAPYRLASLDDPIREHSIEIREVDADNRVVTVVEMLSPTSLNGKGLDEYLDKRARLLRGGVSVVEVCLVRAGGWRGLVAPVDPPGGASAEYCTLIHTAYGDEGGSWLHPMPPPRAVARRLCSAAAWRPSGQARVADIVRPRLRHRPVSVDRPLRPRARAAAVGGGRGLGRRASQGGGAVDERRTSAATGLATPRRRHGGAAAPPAVRLGRPAHAPVRRRSAVQRRHRRIPTPRRRPGRGAQVRARRRECQRRRPQRHHPHRRAVRPVVVRCRAVAAAGGGVEKRLALPPGTGCSSPPRR